MCGIYKRSKGECTAHYIRAVVLESLVLENLRKVIAYVRDYENDFVAQVMHNEQAAKLAQQAGAKRQLEQQTRRMGELDTLIMRLYEDNVSGKLSDERFGKLSSAYEQEQKELETSVSELRKTVEGIERQTVNIKSFIKVVHKYIEPDTLTADILHEFVEKNRCPRPRQVQWTPYPANRHSLQLCR